MTAKEIGAYGEDAAVNHLMRHGYFIRERNFTRRGGEVDIIAERDGCTVFAEVKTRQNDRYGAPSEYVDRNKMERLRRTAAQYPIVEGDIRFDVIEVYYEVRDGVFLVKDIEHIEDAF